MPYVIGAAGGGSVVLAAAAIAGFMWKRKARRKANRRVSAERGQVHRQDPGTPLPGPDISPNPSAAHISKGSLTRRQSASQRVNAAASTRNPPKTWTSTDDLRAVDNGHRATVDVQTMQQLILESERRQAELTKRLLAEQAAMYERMLQNIVGSQREGGTHSIRQNGATNRNSTSDRRQHVEPSAPQLDEIEVLGKGE